MHLCDLGSACVQVQAAAAPAPEYMAAPVLTPEQYAQLCSPADVLSPQKGSPQRGPAQAAPSFVPLGPDEPPGPGMLLGLDAEFVAVSLPDVPVQGCVGLRLRPSSVHADCIAAGCERQGHARLQCEGTRQLPASTSVSMPSTCA